jgi:outer membrane protein assembly factor BamB
LYPDSSGGSFFALDRFTGRETWRVRIPGLGPAQAPIEDAGVAFAGAESGWMYAVDLATGAIRWRTNVQFAVDYITLCGRVLLANNQQLWVLDPKTGNVLQTLFTAEGSDFPTSAFVTLGTRAFVVGDKAAYGLACPG